MPTDHPIPFGQYGERTPGGFLMGMVAMVAVTGLPMVASAQDPYDQARAAGAPRFEQPAPDRIASLGGAKLDTLQWIDETTVALGTFQKNKRGIRQGPLEIYDVASKRRLLEIRRANGADRTGVRRQGGVLLASVVDAREKSGYALTAFTLDPAETLWREDLPIASRLLPAPLHDLVVTLEPARRKTTIVARNPKTGDTLWRIRAAEDAFAEVLSDQILVAQSDALILYDMDAGTPVWQTPVSLTPSAVRGAVSLGDRIGVYDADQLYLFDRATGTLAERAGAGGASIFTAIYSHPTTLIAVTARKTSRRRARNTVSALLGLDRDGAAQWRVDLPGATDTALFVEARAFGYVTGGVATIRSIDTGKVLASNGLPETLRQRADEGLVLRMTGGTAEVLSPYGHFRFDFKGGKGRFTPLAHPGDALAGRSPVAYGSAEHHRAMAGALTADLDLIGAAAAYAGGNAARGSVSLVSALRGPSVSDGARTPGSGTAARQRELRRQILENRDSARRARNAPNAIAAEGRALASAYDSLSVATLETEISAMETQAAFGRNAAMADFAASAANAVNAFLAELEAAADRAARLERHVLADQAQNLLSAGYMVSTPAQAGCTVDVVRLADRAVARIPWRLVACATQNCSPNAALPFPRTSISPDGSYLVFEGPGVSRDGFEPPQRVRDLTFPNMSLMAVDLSALAFTPAEKTVRRPTLFECRG